MTHKYYTLLTVCTLLFATAVTADQHPNYQPEQGTLLIPSIDLDGIPGYYQQAELELIQDNHWQLKAVKQGKLNEDIHKVELIKSDSFPAQVFLKVSGEFTHSCARHGQVYNRLNGNTFTVNAYYENNIWTETPEVVLCAAVMQPFSFVYPLPVYGLPAGEYHYQLNGKFSGTFTLSRDNH